MKLITTIINHDDSSKTLSALTKAGFSVTKLATTGGFLLAGNTTFIIGTDDDKVDTAIGIIREYASRRQQFAAPIGSSADVIAVPVPVEVTVGGAIIFVQNVERFERV